MTDIEKEQAKLVGALFAVTILTIILGLCVVTVVEDPDQPASKQFEERNTK